VQTGADLLRRVVTLGTLEHVKVHIHRCGTHLGCLHRIVDLGLAGHGGSRRTTPRGLNFRRLFFSSAQVKDGRARASVWRDPNVSVGLGGRGVRGHSGVFQAGRPDESERGRGQFLRVPPTTRKHASGFASGYVSEVSVHMVDSLGAGDRWAGPIALDLRMPGRASAVAARSIQAAKGVAVYAGVRHENPFAARTMWHGEVRSAESA
jgi:hypothetical protein